MKSSSLLISMCLVFFVFLVGCKKEKEENPDQDLSTSYSGIMTYEYSKGFPPFSAIASLDVVMSKDGLLTSGEYVPALIQNEAVHYEGGKPAFKYIVTGTVVFDAADGIYQVVNGEGKVLVKLHSVVNMVQEVYDYDEEEGFVLMEMDTLRYEDDYEDATWEFSLEDATIDGSENIVTYPDIEGMVWYGYTLYLVPDIK